MNLLWIPLFGIAAVGGGVLYLGLRIFQVDEGTSEMQRIALAVREGAVAYLKRQYRAVGLFFLIGFILLGILSWKGYLPRFCHYTFLTGGFYSALAGFIGMTVATRASSRTANAARSSLNKALRVAFSSGMIMGLIVVGFALLDITTWYFILSWFYRGLEASIRNQYIASTLLGCSMGASSQALFARVGGGIFTKAADVGADLVGKVEAGIPEDDPRNPAVIADNVGDNVGDVAGMGADLYESYVGSLVAAIALGTAVSLSLGIGKGIIFLPLIIATLGIVASIIGSFFVRCGEEVSSAVLLKALRGGVFISTALVASGSYFVIQKLLPREYIGLYGALLSGLGAGVIIGMISEYYTSSKYSPTRSIAEAAEVGPATVIISGLSQGMLSTVIPVVVICGAMVLSFSFSGGTKSFVLGLYGVALAAVGMLSTLGITLATDAYGPVADNAGGNAEMAHLPSEVRKRTDALDALGNTTAAMGKGFAIGSAALTTLALIATYKNQIELAMSKLSPEINLEMNIISPSVIIGIFIGAMVAFFFCSLTMRAVGRVAQRIVKEVRRQFREIKGLMTGEAKPDYAKCVDISTRGAQREMLLPSLLAILTPIALGLLIGPEAGMGLLLGALACGFTLAVMMANAGGAWDNAKKYIEAGAHGGKGSLQHKAAVVGDTVGDPFKDTSGPSLNILIKLMSIVSVITVSFVIKNTLFLGR
jgi:K(+)-stimulated pyrophosphate-energized sodium pump